MWSFIIWILLSLHVQYSDFCKNGPIKWRQLTETCRQDKTKNILLCLTETRNYFVMFSRDLVLSTGAIGISWITKPYVDNMYNVLDALDIRSRSSTKAFVFVYSGVRYISLDIVLDCVGSRGSPVDIYFLIMRHCERPCFILAAYTVASSLSWICISGIYRWKFNGKSLGDKGMYMSRLPDE
jgi:hypothetical protein